MASKTSQINFSEQGKLLLAELGRDFREVESKGYIWQENVGKKEKPWVGLLTYLTPGNLTVWSTTSVSFKNAGGDWNSSRKKTVTYIVVKSRQRHKEVKSKVKRSVQHHKTFSWYQSGSSRMTGIILFVSNSPWNLVNDCACSKCRYVKLIAGNALAFSFEDLYPKLLWGHFIPSPFSGERAIESACRGIALVG